MSASETPFVHHRRTVLFVLLPGDAQLAKDRERGEDRATDPGAVLALGRGNHSDPGGGRSPSTELSVEAIGQPRKQARATGEHHIAVEISTEIGVTSRDRVHDALVDARRIGEAEHTGLEERLGAAEALCAEGDEQPAVGQLVAALEFARAGGCVQLELVVERHVAQKLWELTYQLALGHAAKAVATLIDEHAQEVLLEL
mmetsp:Transcript_12460/g.37749  ORF Transcript_12460/g.37749 Transcript_12460/m.37749 type:complete len:200 (+) Transcript_12460:412-1011(+)